MTIDFKKYEHFVDAVTSDASTNFVDFADRIGEPVSYTHLTLPTICSV